MKTNIKKHVKRRRVSKILLFIVGLLFLIIIIPTNKTSNTKTSSESNQVTPTPTISASPSAIPEKVNNKISTSKPTILPTPTPTNNSNLSVVTKVVDGDTIQVRINNTVETLRLIGVDTPETVDPRKPVQCFGREASNYTKSTLLNKKVYLESDPTQGDRDKYKRLLRYVFLEDKSNFNKMLISNGYAHEYTYNIPYKYQAEFKQAQKEAQENKRGLWADNACASTTTIQPTKTTTASTTSSNFSCKGKTKCGEMVSCEEAKYYLKYCGVTRLDGDSDGIPCETLCN